MTRHRMVAATQSAVEVLLNRLLKRFTVSVDLGCGVGDAGPLLKRYTNFLVGVDHSRGRLEAIQRRGGRGYDRLILGDVESFRCAKADSVFMFDIVEHLPKEKGYELLDRGRDRFIMITTPSKFFPIACNGHRSLWSVGDLHSLGFNEVYTYSMGIPSLIYGRHILAWRS